MEKWEEYQDFLRSYNVTPEEYSFEKFLTDLDT